MERRLENDRLKIKSFRAFSVSESMELTESVYIKLSPANLKQTFHPEIVNQMSIHTSVIKSIQ